MAQLLYLHERLRPTNDQLLDLEARGVVVERGKWTSRSYELLKVNIAAAQKVHGENIFEYYTQIRGDRKTHEDFVRFIGNGINRTLASVIEKFQREYGVRRVHIDENTRKLNEDLDHLTAYIDNFIEQKYGSARLFRVV